MMICYNLKLCYKTERQDKQLVGEEKHSKTTTDGEEKRMSTKVTVFVGQSGSGKSTFASAIVDEDHRVSSGAIIRRAVLEAGLEPTHENIHQVAMTKIASDPAWQAKQVEGLARGKEFFIFDGPRNPHDVDYFFRKGVGHKVVGFLAPWSVRYRRLISRERKGVDPRAFITRCVDEVLEAGLNHCLLKADIFVINGGESIESANRLAIRLKQVLFEESECLAVSKITSPPMKRGDALASWRACEKRLEELQKAILPQAAIREFLQDYFRIEELILTMLRENRLSVDQLVSI